MFDKTKPFDINWELNNICNLYAPNVVGMKLWMVRFNGEICLLVPVLLD